MTSSPEDASPDDRAPIDAGQAEGMVTRRAGLIAAVAGVIAVVAAVLTPFLPVTTSMATITWPQGQQLDAKNPAITASLVAQSPQSLDITIPCELLRSLPTGKATTVLSTMPAGAKDVRSNALLVMADDNTVTVVSRGTTMVSAPRTDIGSARCAGLHIWAGPDATGARFNGLGPATTIDPHERPQVSGVFTDLATPVVTSAAAPTNGAPGLAVRITVDDRFDSSPTVLKWIVMVVGVLAALIALIALYLLDRTHGYHRRVGRLGLLRLLRPRVTDIAVTAILLLWHFLGAGSPDDGYILNMGRNAEHSGYLSNYYRFAGIPEAPFDWYYDFLAHWSAVSTAGIWMRLPSLVVGLVSWFVLSRILLPRLGRAVRNSQWAMVTGAAVFLAFWLPMCSGLRSEGIIVLGTLLTWWAVEQTVATRRMLPAAAAAFTASLTLVTAPHGLIAVALLFTGARPMLRILIRRRRESGLLALLAPLMAAPAIVLIIVFRDQTLANVYEAINVRYTVGPTLAWYQELLRYYFLAVTTRDGSLVRRVPVLLLAASLFVMLAIMLRRKRISGVASGPVWRVLGAVLVTILAMSFTPTKWTIQFGVYAGLAAALAAVACVAIAQAARRTTRNLSILIAGLSVACAAAAAGKNAWPWAFDFGIPWFDKAPVIAGVQVSTVFLVFAVVALLIALWQHLRLDYVAETGLAHEDQQPPNRWRLGVASAPIAVIAVVIVVAQLAVFGKAAVARSDTFTVFTGNAKALTGNACGMADRVLVEPDANQGMLTPVDGGDTPAAKIRALQGQSRGFRAQGVADDLMPEAGSLRPGTMNTSADLSKPFIITGGNPGTTGGRGPVGMNGSPAALPFGLNPATTPVMGSFDAPEGQGSLTTGWYTLPQRGATPLIVLSAAGAIGSVDPDGVGTFGQSLQVEFSSKGAPVGKPVIPIDADRGNRPWRNLRVPTAWIPPRADAMRIVARDNNLDPKQWLAITPPRAPRLKTLENLVGTQAPVLVDFAVGAMFPCQHPMAATHGVNQIPQWRILPEPSVANSQSKTWMAAKNGGLLTTADALTTPSTMATYLENDWYRDWGSLQKLSPLVPDAVPARIADGTENRWGWQYPGPMRVVAQDE